MASEETCFRMQELKIASTYVLNEPGYNNFRNGEDLHSWNQFTAQKQCVQYCETMYLCIWNSLFAFNRCVQYNETLYCC